jgi:hypothetical protein
LLVSVDVEGVVVVELVSGVVVVSSVDDVSGVVTELSVEGETELSVELVSVEA